MHMHLYTYLVILYGYTAVILQSNFIFDVSYNIMQSDNHTFLHSNANGSTSPAAISRNNNPWIVIIGRDYMHTVTV
jgi:hypothetical protein